MAVSAALFTDVEFDSPEAWGAFQIVHGLDHQNVYDRLNAQGKVPVYVPLLEFPREDNEDYLLMHWQVHQSNARLLNIIGVPDLATVDLTDQAQYQDWLQIHTAVHQAENRALGI